MAMRMMTIHCGIAAIFSLYLLHCFSSPINGFSLHRPKLRSLDQCVDIHEDPPSSSSSPAPSPSPATTYFEISRPISVPKSKPCSVLLLQHVFAYTYGKPPVTAPYSPPSHCISGAGEPSVIVLRWVATSHGLQFDRIFGVWLGGVELLRSCTGEPLAGAGIVWTVEKDVTRYAATFSKPSTIAVHLANIVDKTYTGVYNVTLSVDFFFSVAGDDTAGSPPPPGFGSPADLIIPISRNPIPANSGQWFEVKNSTAVESEPVGIPSNTFRAVLELYISFHSDDEFWYTNPPNEYIAENNLTGVVPGNGPFREVTVRLAGGDVVGAVWPFTVIYTGGVNPLLWRPITGIGSFDLPSYDIELTPFLGELLDGRRNHSFVFAVAGALDVWFVDANLHLWIDPEISSLVAGMTTTHEAPAREISEDYEFQGLDGEFETKTSRKIVSTGWVSSSYGNFTTRSVQELEFSSSMVIGNNGGRQEVRNRVESYRGTFVEDRSSGIHYSEKVFQSFPLKLSTVEVEIDPANGSYSLDAGVELGFNEKRVVKMSGKKKLAGTLRNSQVANGVMEVKGGLVRSGVGRNHQVYMFAGGDGCYFRNASAANYKILYDVTEDRCLKKGIDA